MRPLTIAVDFDGVIHDCNPDPGRKLGRPTVGAVQALTDWDQAGHTIIIHTVRGNQPHVHEWLEYFGIPYDTVTDVKPNADVYLDDRAVRFVDWPQARQAVAAL